jgi:ABC-2 type transport system ATP-binding protein
MDAITDRLLFKLSADPAETARAIYSESSLKGHALIVPNTEREDSRPDLEMLYKAIVLNGEKMNAFFQS